MKVGVTFKNQFTIKTFLSAPILVLLAKLHPCIKSWLHELTVVVEPCKCRAHKFRFSHTIWSIHSDTIKSHSKSLYRWKLLLQCDWDL